MGALVVAGAVTVMFREGGMADVSCGTVFSPVDWASQSFRGYVAARCSEALDDQRNLAILIGAVGAAAGVIVAVTGALLGRRRSASAH